jgi:hypothetical protein
VAQGTSPWGRTMAERSGAVLADDKRGKAVVDEARCQLTSGLEKTSR